MLLQSLILEYYMCMYSFAYCVYVFLYILPKQHLDDGSKKS